MLTIYKFLGFEENILKLIISLKDQSSATNRKGLAARLQEYPEQNMPTKTYNPYFPNCSAQRMQKLRDYFQLLQQYTRYGLTYISLKCKVKTKKIRKSKKKDIQWGKKGPE